MKRLRTILQSKYLFKIAFLLTILIGIIYTTNYKHKCYYDENSDTFIGIVTSYEIMDKKLVLEISAEEKIIVNYKYDSKTEYILTGDISGYGDYNREVTPNELKEPQEQHIAQDNTLGQWKVLRIHDDGSVDIIPSKTTTAKVKFMGPKGFTNGPTAINNICREHYSNSELGIYARNINLNDIESQLNEYGRQVRENTKNGDGTLKYGDSRDYNDIFYPIQGELKNETSITIKNTRWVLNDSELTKAFQNEEVTNIFNELSDDNFWLASNFNDCGSYQNKSGVWYGLADSGQGVNFINCWVVCDSFGGVNEESTGFSLCPIVSIPPRVKLTETEEAGVWNLNS